MSGQSGRYPVCILAKNTVKNTTRRTGNLQIDHDLDRLESNLPLWGVVQDLSWYISNAGSRIMPVTRLPRTDPTQ